MAKFVILVSAVLSLAGCITTDGDQPGQRVWDVVKARHQAWVKNDKAAFFATYHPDFARWTRSRNQLESTRDLDNFWANIRENERSVSIKVEPERLQFLAEGRIAIAHYTVIEVVEYVGRPYTQRGRERFGPGERATYRIPFSDIYENMDGRWLYAGGHRDGASLPYSGRMP